MKKVCINQIMFLLFAILVISCGKDDNEIVVQSVSLNYSTLDMMVGDTKTLAATILPEEAEQKIMWSSSDPKVVTVNEAGVVVAVMEGTASISVRTIDGSKSAVCYVTVKAYNIVGHWQQIWSESYKYNISSPDKHEDATSGSVVENNFFYWFKADGTGIDIDGYSFDWSLAGDKVISSYSGSKYEAKILKLDESELVWEEREADEENSNIIYYEKGTFKKVDESSIPYNPLAGTWMEPYDTSIGRDEFEVLIWTFRRNWTCDLLWYYFEFPYSYIGYDVENAHYAINKVDQTLTVKEADDEMKYNITIANNNFWTQDMKGKMLNYINYGRDFTNPAPNNVSGYRFTLGNRRDVNLIFENNTHAQFLYTYIINQPQLNLPQCAYQKKSATTATLMITLKAEYGISGSSGYVAEQRQYTFNLFYTGTDVGYCTGKVSWGDGVVYDEQDNQIGYKPAGESKIKTTPFILKKENTAKNLKVLNNNVQDRLNIDAYENIK